MGDISIKGKSPILTKGQRLLSRGMKKNTLVVIYIIICIYIIF